MRRIILFALAASVPLAAFGGSLELVVLGSGGPRPFGRAGSSYIVEVNGTPRILVDAGPGAFVRIGEMHLDLDQVDTVLLTHLHIDHTGDLPAFFKARTLTTNASKIRFTVFGPSGGGMFPNTTRFLDLLFEKGGAWEYQKTFGADEEIRGVDLPISLNSPIRKIVDTGGVRITTIATHHGDCPSVAYRIDYGNESIAFSGDMDQSAVPNLVRLAKGCSLLVFHCAVLDPPNSPQQLYALHTPPRRIGEAARDAGAQRLLLSHTAPDVEKASRPVLQSIRASYKQPVSFARDKMRVAVAP
ncbi:MAG TPA: MBL fold metallo-hydrolase [Bryobacteraceae bacterium]|nr:MBL fold metallo-hydrolase [Bryobacteraceae bacterium]